MKIRALPIRVSPKEILLVSSLFRSSLVECDSVEECDRIWQFLRGESKDEELLERFRKAGLLEEEGGCFRVVGEGAIAEGLSALVKSCENPVFTVYAYDVWRPSLFREITLRSRRSGDRSVIVFTVFDLGVISPMAGLDAADYICMEQQMSAAFTWVFRTVRDALDWLDATPKIDDAIALFMSSFSYLVLRRAASNFDILMNRAVVVDFYNLFIDVLKVFKTPHCYET